MSKTNIPCVILSGGRSRRFDGGQKELAILADKPVLSHVIDRIAPQCGQLVINASADNLFKQFELPVIADVIDGGLGPLVGIHTAMKWARERNYDRVLTSGNDSPFLPKIWAEKLAEVEMDTIAVSFSKNRQHFIHALWPTVLVDQLEKDIQAGAREVGKWLAQQDYKSVSFDPIDGIDPFFNINTREDLNDAEQALQQLIRQ